MKEQSPAEGYDHTLLIRRSKGMRTRKSQPASCDIEYFLVHVPVATTLPAMIRAVGLRWKIEEDNKTGKDQLGMDQYQVRTWAPWHRHVATCMLAQVFLAVTRAGRGKRRCARKARRPAEDGWIAAVDRDDPWAARRDRAGPRRRCRCRDHPCVMASGPPGQGPDQLLPSARRPAPT